MQGTPVIYKKVNFVCFIYYATTKSEIHICSSKRETGLVITKLEGAIGHSLLMYFLRNRFSHAAAHRCGNVIKCIGGQLPEQTCFVYYFSSYYYHYNFLFSRDRSTYLRSPIVVICCWRPNIQSNYVYVALTVSLS